MSTRTRVGESTSTRVNRSLTSTFRGEGAVGRGLAIAQGAAVISGVAVFLNGYAVRQVSASATAYTTAKNLVAALLLSAGTAWMWARPRGLRGVPGTVRQLPSTRQQLVLLLVIAVVGGSVPFILFFEGLARTSATEAALIQKSLVVWVAILAVPLLKERLGPLHLLAIGLLVAGQALLVGRVGGLRVGGGEAMILAATLCWTVETVVLKVALRSIAPAVVGTTRLGLGVVLLLAYLAVRGQFSALATLGATGWWWAIVTGAVLAGYVTAWLGALARARAVDVTAVLVGAALITAFLDAGLRGVPAQPRAASLTLILTGVAMVAFLARRPAAPHPA